MSRVVRSTAAVGAGLAIAGTLAAPAASAASVSSTAAVPAAVSVSRDATYATALNGVIPCAINRGYDELGCGRMVNGRLPGAGRVLPGGHINIKHIETGRLWQHRSVRLIDVAGDRRKEAVVLISASAGGVGWPNQVIVYDGNGKVLNLWDSGAATAADPREGTTFGRSRTTSLDVRVDGVQKPGEGACCGTGSNVYRLYKNSAGRAAWKLVSRA